MSQNAITYPPGVRDLTEDISTDDLVRRLKDCSQAFSNMSQEDDNSAYIPLALYLASETFLEHRNTEVRLLVACCIADVFRVYAPEAPYKDVPKLKDIFLFFVNQLKGLDNPQSSSFKLYFYLLENLSAVKTFNICFEFDDNQHIMSLLFKQVFKVVSDQHTPKVRKFMFDMLCPLITESDQLSHNFLNIILGQIVEPLKSKNKFACALAQDIITTTAAILEPYIQDYFNNALILGKLPGDISCNLFDLIYELNAIAPAVMSMVLPQLEIKLKSTDETERMEVTKAVAKMCADKRSNMIDQNKPLWSNFLLRFQDISAQIRLLCVQFCKQFLLNHPESKDDITEMLEKRIFDADEEVRYHVVSIIVDVAHEDFDAVNEPLLKLVKERTYDKKFRIRKVAMIGLARVYKKYLGSRARSSYDSISWIKDQILHMYYLPTLDDRLVVERIIHTSFIPYQKPMEERMKLLYQLYCSIDPHAVKAFKEILRCQRGLRTHVKTLLETIQKDKSKMRLQSISNKISVISQSLSDEVKSKQYLTKFCKDLEENSKMRSMMSVLLNKNITCADAENKVKEILKCLGSPVQTNHYYTTIKLLLERIAPVLIDKGSIKFLVHFVKDSLINNCAIEAELGLQNSAQLGLDLLLVLAYTFPHTFYDEDTYNNLMLFLKTEYSFAADITLQILINVSNNLEANFPEVCKNLISLLEGFIETGSSKQAKHAVYCINNIVSDKQNVFGKIIDNLKQHLTLESQYFRTALVSIGHIAFLNSNMFATDLKAIISKIIYDLLMLDQDFPRGGTNLWGPFDSLPDETKCKIEGMKVMVRWLAGLKDFVAPASSTLILLTTVLTKDGELGDHSRESNMAPVEKSWMRISAASCILKLCHEPNYNPLVDLKSYLILASVINDKCPEVCERFAKKLHKGISYLKLPLEYLAIFTLGGLNERKEFQEQTKRYLKQSIQKLRHHVKDNRISGEKLLLFLPDYSLAYAVWLLAHSKVLKTYDDVPGLRKIKECLKIMLDSLIVKNESYSYPFLKRLLENIKQTKDKKSLPQEDDTEEDRKAKEDMNWKMYAVCDLALNMILSKPNLTLKEFPAEPFLNSMFFTEPDKSYSNMKTYAPPELLEPLKPGFEMEMVNTTKNMNSTPHSEQTTTNSIDHTVLPSTSYNESNAELSSSSNPPRSPVIQRNMRSKTVIQHTRYAESSPNRERHSDTENLDVASDNSIAASNLDEASNSEPISKDSGVSSTASKKNGPGRPRKTMAAKKVSEPVVRSKRSSRNSNLSSPSSHLKKNLTTTQQNGNASSSPSEASINSSCLSSFQHLIKECNVRLSKDEVENYSARSSQNSSDQLSDNTVRQNQKSIGRKRRAVSDKSSVETRTESSFASSPSTNSLNTRSETPVKRNKRLLENSEADQPSTLNKRKREITVPKRFLQNKADNSTKSQSSSVSKSPVKSPIKNGKPSRATKSLQKTTQLSNHLVSSKVNNSAEKGLKGSKSQLRVNSRKQQPNTRQKKNAEVKTTGKRR